MSVFYICTFVQPLICADTRHDLFCKDFAKSSQESARPNLRNPFLHIELREKTILDNFCCVEINKLNFIDALKIKIKMHSPHNMHTSAQDTTPTHPAFSTQHAH